MKKLHRLQFRFGMVGILFILAGCVAPKQKAPMEPMEPIAWNRDSSAAIIAYQKPVLPEDDLSYSLTELNRGLLFFENGDYIHADTRFHNATAIMSQIVEKGETRAVLWDERKKTFKGEPYERATAFFYRGLCHFNVGDYPGALAAFRSSLASDEETRNPDVKFLQDFTISQFMAALCDDRLGHSQDAEEMLRLARSNAPSSNPYLEPENLRKNFIAIIGVGEGPFKTMPTIKFAPTASTEFEAGESPEKSVQFLIDDRAVGNAAEATDLLFQAMSQKRGTAANAQTARTVVKDELAGVVPYGLGHLFIYDRWDLRSWRNVPLKFYIFAADIPPGLHRITLKPYDQNGKEIERCRQTWLDVPVLAQGGPVLYLRTKRNWQNEYGLRQVKVGQPQQVSEK